MKKLCGLENTTGWLMQTHVHASSFCALFVSVCEQRLQHTLHGLSGNVLQGVQVVAEIDLPKPAKLDAQKVRVHRLLALEGLQDPGNLVSQLMLCTILKQIFCKYTPHWWLIVSSPI